MCQAPGKHGQTWKREVREAPADPSFLHPLSVRMVKLRDLNTAKFGVFTPKGLLILSQTHSQALPQRCHPQQVLPGGVELSLLDQVLQPPERSKIPAWVVVVEMLLLIHGVMAGGTVWGWDSTGSAALSHLSWASWHWAGRELRSCSDPRSISSFN